MTEIHTIGAVDLFTDRRSRLYHMSDWKPTTLLLVLSIVIQCNNNYRVQNIECLHSIFSHLSFWLYKDIEYDVDGISERNIDPLTK